MGASWQQTHRVVDPAAIWRTLLWLLLELQHIFVLTLSRHPASPLHSICSMDRLPRVPMAKPRFRVRRSEAQISAVCAAVRQIMIAPAPSVGAWLEAIAAAARPVMPVETAAVAIFHRPHAREVAGRWRIGEISVAAPVEMSDAQDVHDRIRRSLDAESDPDIRMLQELGGNSLVVSHSERTPDDEQHQGAVRGDNLGDWLRAFALVGREPIECAVVIDLRASGEPWKPTPAQRACAGELALSAAHAYEQRIAARHRQRQRLLESLSPAQREVLPLLVAGLSEREIARRIGRSAHTIHGHSRAICLAWGVTSRLGLQFQWLGVPREEASDARDPQLGQIEQRA